MKYVELFQFHIVTLPVISDDLLIETPLGFLPILETENGVLAESVAIWYYLATKLGELNFILSLTAWIHRLELYYGKSLFASHGASICKL